VAAQLSFELVAGVFAAAVAVMNDAGDVPAAAVHGHRDRIHDQRVLRWLAIDQPSTMRLNTSVTQAR
jgi:DNA-binding IclR family transcriptional regulator